ncbi:hypothetical protein GCM10027049_29880 [Mucilaginibacter puniceus]
MKAAITLSLLITSITCLAQKQSVFFLKNDGASVELKDSADFIRIVTEPDPGSELFNVTDIYKSGKKKLVGKSSTQDLPTMFEGQTIEYFENGKRQAISNYAFGKPVKERFEYFPNGKLYITKQYTDPPKDKPHEHPFLIIANYDSLGTALVKDGNGYYKAFDYKFERIFEEGPVKNGLRDGKWKGREDTISFVETYKDGVLIDGLGTSKSGLKSSYKNARETLPLFKGGNVAFLKFLANNIRYPVDDREKNIQGKVVLIFDVNINGVIENINFISAPTVNMVREAIRVLRLSPDWIPARKFGRNIPFKSYTVPVNYTLGEER